MGFVYVAFVIRGDMSRDIKGIFDNSYLAQLFKFANRYDKIEIERFPITRNEREFYVHYPHLDNNGESI